MMTPRNGITTWAATSWLVLVTASLSFAGCSDTSAGVRVFAALGFTSHSSLLQAFWKQHGAYARRASAFAGVSGSCSGGVLNGHGPSLVFWPASV